MISQFEDMPPDEAAESKRQFGLDDDRFEVMFEVLGRWAMSPRSCTESVRTDDQGRNRPHGLGAGRDLICRTRPLLQGP